MARHGKLSSHAGPGLAAGFCRSAADAARAAAAGSALTTFNKGNVNLSPKIIAHRSSATRHEMLVNPPAYAQFCHKAHINDHVRARLPYPNPMLVTPPA